MNIVDYGEYESYSSLEFYKKAKETQTGCSTEPLIDEATGFLVSSVADPIFVDGKFVGVCCADILADNFEKIKSTSDAYPALYNVVLNQNGVIMYHSKNEDMIGQNMDAAFQKQEHAALAKEKMAQGEAFNIQAKNAKGTDVYQFYSSAQVGADVWWTCNTVDVSDVDASATKTGVLLLIVAIVAAVLLLAAVTSMLRKMLNPVAAIVAAANSISEGQLDIELQADSKDEIGEF